LDTSSHLARRLELSTSFRKYGGFFGVKGIFRELENSRPEVLRTKKKLWCIWENDGLMKMVVGVDITILEVSQYTGKLLVGRFNGKTIGTQALLNWLSKE